MEEPELTEQSQGETIRLDNYLKFEGIAMTGGHAKLLIQSGSVSVNGEPETRRRRQLRDGDLVVVDDEMVQAERRVQLGEG